MKYGDPLAGKTNMRGYPCIAQYLAKVDKRGPDDCWPWKACRAAQNYGQFNDETGTIAAHRYGFAQLVRPLQPGETVDHTCHNRDPECQGGDTCEHRACQNPAHWEAVPFAINKARAWDTRSSEVAGQRIAVLVAGNTSKTHCPAGHEYTEENTYRVHGGRGRQCKTCTKAKAAARASDPAIKAARSAREKAERAERAGRQR